MTTPLYDAFSADYDRFVDWDGRLAYELPFIERQLVAVGAKRVLDAACGTGMHAIALAERGYTVVGADVSDGMIRQARRNADLTGFENLSGLTFFVAEFGELAERVGGDFDALLCLGSSLPHALTEGEMQATLANFAAVLRPGGLLFIQNRNFDAALAGRERWMGPQAHREGSREWLFVRFYDFNPDGTLAFNVLTLQRDAAQGGGWRQQVESTRLRPWLHAELVEMVAAAGFRDITPYGDMTGALFDPQISGNLIATALKG